MTVVPLPLEQNQPGDTLVHGSDGGSVVRRSVLPGGVRVLTILGNDGARLTV